MAKAAKNEENQTPAAEDAASTDALVDVELTADFTFYRNGCWPEIYPAGAVKMDAEALVQAEALGLIEKGEK